MTVNIFEMDIIYKQEKTKILKEKYYYLKNFSVGPRKWLMGESIVACPPLNFVDELK